MKGSVVAAIAVACAVIGAMVGARSGAFGGRGAEPALAANLPAAATASSALPSTKAAGAASAHAKIESGGPARTELVVVCEPECAMIYVDGKKVASPTEPVAVTAGSHEIVAVRPGYAQGLKRVTLVDGQSEAVTFQLAARPGR